MNSPDVLGVLIVVACLAAVAILAFALVTQDGDTAPPPADPEVDQREGSAK